jgi:phage-related holin
MNMSELYVAGMRTINQLAHGAALKAAGSFVFAVFAHMHTQLLLCFALLVCIDLLTKWIALSRERLLKNKRKTNPTFYECVLGLRKARRAGYIKSSEMKHRFVGKIIVYMTIALAGAMFDTMMRTLGKPEWAVFLLVGYLAMTEIMSIVENLQDAGVSVAEDLHDILNKKLEGMKK